METKIAFAEKKTFLRETQSFLVVSKVNQPETQLFLMENKIIMLEMKTLPLEMQINLTVKKIRDFLNYR